MNSSDTSSRTPTIEQNILEIVHLYIVFVFSIIFTFGTIGNLCNMVVFIGFRQLRKYPGAFYIIAESVASLGVLLVGCGLRIIEEVFILTPDRIAFVWCKIRNPVSQWCVLMVLSLVNFSVIDQYFSTNCRPEIRRLSTMKLSIYLTIIASIIWLLYNIPFAMYFAIKIAFGCFIANIDLNRFYSYFHLFILCGLLPMTLASVFSISAYQNVRRIHRQQMSQTRRRLDYQLTAMILARVILFVLCLLPYIAQCFYTVNVQNKQSTPLRAAIELLVAAINISIAYINVSGSFYVFLLSSSRFRRQVKLVLTKTFRKYFPLMCNRVHQSANNNQVTPM